MKTIFLKLLLIINLLFIFSCKAQTTTDYINFYNNVVPKLNSIIPNKTQFYGQNFSNFSNELQNKNINIVMLGYDYKTDHDTKFQVLNIFFSDFNMWNIATENSYRFPRIKITFENEIPNQIRDLVAQYEGEWNPTFEQFFANMKIEKIEFIGVKGYNVEDWSE
ncbi:hypothetical protein [Chryseobacterium wanjuense]